MGRGKVHEAPPPEGLQTVVAGGRDITFFSGIAYYSLEVSNLPHMAGQVALIELWGGHREMTVGRGLEKFSMGEMRVVGEKD